MPRNVTVSPREHDLFSRMADSAKQLHSDALEMSKLRPDQRNQWEQIAVLMKVLEGQVFDIATGGLLSREQADGRQ